MPSIPVEEVLSFLKDTRSALTWTVRDMAESLKISESEAKEIIAIQELQGYVKPALALNNPVQHNEYLTTIDGEAVSGSTPPRFTIARVNETLSALETRIKTANLDRRAAFQITDAVAFGDFLTGRPRVQAADVGVRLTSRNQEGIKSSTMPSEREYLKQLRAGSALIRLQTYKPWMSHRSHRKLA